MSALVDGPYEFTFRKVLPSSSYVPTPSFLSLVMLCHVVAGSLQVLALQLLHYEGAAENGTMLTSTAVYAGMMLSLATPQSVPKGQVQRTHSITLEQQTIFLISILDLLGLSCCIAGITFIGTSLFQIILNGLLVVATLISWLFLQRSVSLQQWFFIFVLVLGIALAVLYFEADGGAERWEYVAGVTLTMAGTFISGCKFLLNERLMRFAKLSPQLVCFFVGCYACFFCGIYLTVFTFPNWQSWVLRHLESHAGNLVRIFVCYVCLVLCSFAFNYSAYALFSLAGSRPFSLLHAARTVAVFLASSFLFCDIDTSQCMSPMKILSLIVVCVGLIGYFLVSHPFPHRSLPDTTTPVIFSLSIK